MHHKMRLTIIDDADHHTTTGNVVPPNWHHVQVQPTGVTLALCKLNTHRYFNNLKRIAARSLPQLVIFSLTSVAHQSCRKPGLSSE